MKFHWILLGLALFFSFCGSKTREAETTAAPLKSSPEDTLRISNRDTLIDTNALGILFAPGGNYALTKTSAINLKSKVKASEDSVQQRAIENLILNEIIPYWYGTPWDFSGYTETPRKGVVACGYFVSTVMKHAGFNLNRYKLAQQDPMNEARSLACGDSVEVYEGNSEDLQKIFNEHKREGLYFVGLDFHVGFLLYRNKEMYFIHSNYINSEGVIFEKAVYSDAFNASSTYRIAAISTNGNLLESWVKNSEIKIVTGK